MKTKLAQRKKTTSRLTSYLFGFGSGLLVAVLYGAFDQSATEDSASDLPQVVQAPASDQKIDRID